jgi:type IV pilus assembly protein PilN
MILINLLPHREEKRRLRKQAFMAGLVASGIAGLALVVVWYGIQMQMISAQQARNAVLTDAIQKLDVEIKDVASLQGEIEALKARQRAVEDLQSDRNAPVHLLNELVAQTPEGIYLTSVRHSGENVLITGLAQSNERVSEFLRNTNGPSPWFHKPELVEIKVAARAAGQGAGKQRLFEFSMRLGLKRPQDAATVAPASGASVPAVAAKG